MAISRRGAQVKGNGCGPEPESGKISGFAPRGACPNTMSSIALPADISTPVAPEPRPGKPAPAEAMACMPAPSEADFECRAHSAHAEGDHVILVARVERCEKTDALQPLLYHRGRLLAGAEL